MCGGSVGQCTHFAHAGEEERAEASRRPAKRRSRRRPDEALPLFHTKGKGCPTEPTHPKLERPEREVEVLEERIEGSNIIERRLVDGVEVVETLAPDGTSTVGMAPGVIEHQLVCKPARCRSSFCPTCTESYGMRLRQRVTPIIESFESVIMLTLTIDPKLFESPREAFEYVRKHRCVSKLVDALFRDGHLLSRRFFCVIEWQKDTEMPHWHLLVETHRVPFIELARLWGKFRPRSAPAWPYSYSRGLRALKGVSPEFGHVRFSKLNFESKQHAALYATKYVTKYPEHGFPSWVFDMSEEGKQIKRYTTSHGFFGCVKGAATEDETAEEEGERHEADCFCETCRTGEQQAKPRQRRQSIRQRLAKCGRDAIIVEIPVVFDGEKIRNGRPSFFCGVSMSYANALRMCVLNTTVGLDVDTLRTKYARGFRLRDGELELLTTAWRDLQLTGLAGDDRRRDGSYLGGEVNPGDVARCSAFDEWNTGCGTLPEEATNEQGFTDSEVAVAW